MPNEIGLRKWSLSWNPSPPYPGANTRPLSERYEDPQQGWGSAFRPSRTPNANRMMAFEAPDRMSGSTMISGPSPALNSFRSLLRRRERSPWSFGGLFWRSDAAGDLRKYSAGLAPTGFDASTRFDESKVRRDDLGRFAPKYGEWRSGGKIFHPEDLYSLRQLPGGPSPHVKSQLASLGMRGGKQREDLEAYKPDVPEPLQGTFKKVTFKLHKPKTLTQEQYFAVARAASKIARDMRDEVIKGAIEKRGAKGQIRLTGKEDMRDVKLAYRHATNLALHDVGLFNYDFEMTDETKQRLLPLTNFIWHARRKIGARLRDSDFAVIFGDMRREFGKPFKDGRTYVRDTKSGNKAGDPKKAMYPHWQLIKADVHAPALRKMLRGAASGALKFLGSKAVSGLNYAARRLGEGAGFTARYAGMAAGKVRDAFASGYRSYANHLVNSYRKQLRQTRAERLKVAQEASKQAQERSFIETNKTLMRRYRPGRKNFIIDNWKYGAGALAGGGAMYLMRSRQQQEQP